MSYKDIVDWLTTPWDKYRAFTFALVSFLVFLIMVAGVILCVIYELSYLVPFFSIFLAFSLLFSMYASVKFIDILESEDRRRW